MSWSAAALEQSLVAHGVAEARSLAERWAAVPSPTWGVSEVVLVEAAVSRAKARLGEVDVEGLALAVGCLAGNREALAQLEAEVLPKVARTLGRRAPRDAVDEAMQVLRARLLAAEPGDVPKLALYSGRGPLGAFVRIAAMNVLSNLRPQVVHESDEALGRLPDASDLESQLGRRDQQLKFREAFRAAVQTLSPRERSLLRLSLLDGLSIDDLAPMYGTHRATVARWLSGARERLASATREILRVDLGLEPDEVERLLSSAQGGFEVSLSRALRETSPARGV